MKSYSERLFEIEIKPSVELLKMCEKCCQLLPCSESFGFPAPAEWVHKYKHSNGFCVMSKCVLFHNVRINLAYLYLFKIYMPNTKVVLESQTL